MAAGLGCDARILTNGGRFEKLEFRAQTESGQKIRLYHLKDLTSEKIENARLAILQKCQQGYIYGGKLETFEIEISTGNSEPSLFLASNSFRSLIDFCAVVPVKNS